VGGAATDTGMMEADVVVEATTGVALAAMAATLVASVSDGGEQLRGKPRWTGPELARILHLSSPCNR
jgi:hypothetical protein